MSTLTDLLYCTVLVDFAVSWLPRHCSEWVILVTNSRALVADSRVGVNMALTLNANSDITDKNDHATRMDMI
jgi:hypothetical protein